MDSSQAQTQVVVERELPESRLAVAVLALELHENPNKLALKGLKVDSGCDIFV